DIDESDSATVTVCPETQITLLKFVTNDDGGMLTPSNWDLTLTPSGSGSSTTVDGDNAITGDNTVTIDEGTYAVSEASTTGDVAYLLAHVQRYTGPDADQVGQI